jgi:carbon monoxide dehydrogenase subunit G
MASSPTTRNRLGKQATGDNTGTWGTTLNAQTIDLIDESLDGFSSVAVAAGVTLTSTNYATDQARKRVLKFTGAGGFKITIPGVEKFYVVDNQCSAAITIGTSGGVAASIATGTVTGVYCDATDCTAFTQGTGAAATTSVSGIVELATAAEALTGTDTVRALTPSSIGTSNQSLGTTGYKKLPGGLIIQWGIAAFAAASTGTFSFTTTFSSVYAVLVNSEAETVTAAVTSFTTSGLTIKLSASSSMNCRYIAIGA